MKKTKLILLAGLAMAVSMTGCQKKEVKPGDVAGYDEGEQYLSIWVTVLRILRKDRFTGNL